jgi:hypothetical protein
VNLPIGVIALFAAQRVVPDSRDTAVTKIPDMIEARRDEQELMLVPAAAGRGPTAE